MTASIAKDDVGSCTEDDMKWNKHFHIFELWRQWVKITDDVIEFSDNSMKLNVTNLDVQKLFDF